MMSLDLAQARFINLFSNWLNDYLRDAEVDKFAVSALRKSQEYSLLSGGKRFRPFLAYSVFSLFSDGAVKVKNVCLSVEMIHTYSLIHDDLPCMDNDDLRRGRPTNHKIFSENVALLAGDGLLTDAFYLLASDDYLKPETKVELINLFARKTGSFGMVGGQTLDMQLSTQPSLEQLRTIHELKTANLIQTAAVGGAIAAGASESEIHNISDFSHALGMAFQIKDDLLDLSDGQQDFKNYASILGLEKTRVELHTYSDKAHSALHALKLEDQVLTDLVDYNLKRET